MCFPALVRFVALLIAVTTMCCDAERSEFQAELLRRAKTAASEYSYVEVAAFQAEAGLIQEACDIIKMVQKSEWRRQAIVGVAWPLMKNNGRVQCEQFLRETGKQLGAFADDIEYEQFFSRAAPATHVTTTNLSSSAARLCHLR